MLIAKHTTDAPPGKYLTAHSARVIMYIFYECLPSEHLNLHAVWVYWVVGMLSKTSGNMDGLLNKCGNENCEKTV